MRPVQLPRRQSVDGEQPQEVALVRPTVRLRLPALPLRHEVRQPVEQTSREAAPWIRDVRRWWRRCSKAETVGHRPAAAAGAGRSPDASAVLLGRHRSAAVCAAAYCRSSVQPDDRGQHDAAVVDAAVVAVYFPAANGGRCSSQSSVSTAAAAESNVSVCSAVYGLEAAPAAVPASAAAVDVVVVFSVVGAGYR